MQSAAFVRSGYRNAAARPPFLSLRRMLAVLSLPQAAKAWATRRSTRSCFLRLDRLHFPASVAATLRFQVSRQQRHAKERGDELARPG